MLSLVFGNPVDYQDERNLHDGDSPTEGAQKLQIGFHISLTQFIVQV